jgi:hypothetical protein
MNKTHLHIVSQYDERMIIFISVVPGRLIKE